MSFSSIVLLSSALGAISKSEIHCAGVKCVRKGTVHQFPGHVLLVFVYFKPRLAKILAFNVHRVEVSVYPIRY